MNGNLTVAIEFQLPNLILGLIGTKCWLGPESCNSEDTYQFAQNGKNSIVGQLMPGQIKAFLAAAYFWLSIDSIRQSSQSVDK